MGLSANRMGASGGLVTTTQHDRGAGGEILSPFVEIGTGTNTPSGPPSGEVVWYDASQNVTHLVGTSVTKWGDSSGSSDSNRDAVASGVPVFNASDAAYNNKPTISLAAGAFLQSGTWSISPTSQPFTIYIAGHTLSAALEAFLDGLDAGTGQLSLYTGAGDGNLNLFAGSGSITGAANVSAPCVICAEYNGASSAIYVTDHTTAKVSGNPGANVLKGLTLGAFASGAHAMNGKLAEVIAYARADSVAQRLAAMQYLGTKYGLTVT